MMSNMSGSNRDPHRCTEGPSFGIPLKDFFFFFQSTSLLSGNWICVTISCLFPSFRFIL